MFWRLLPHATCCLVSDRLFLLDLRQDRYFTVPDSPAASMRAWLQRGFACAPPDDVTAPLRRGRILRPGDPEPTNALKERVMIPTALDCPAVLDDATIPRGRQAAAIAAAWLRLRLRPLHRILSARHYRSLPQPRGGSDAISSLAARYELGRAHTPITRNCLLDSLALDSLLARRGLDVALVFGVCPTPFSAHCWLQTPDLILNDSFDHVSRFTPIYAS